jgi:signal transduction histidine kinase
MNLSPPPQENPDKAFLRGVGEMAELATNLDWAATALGPPALWPQSLKTAASICLQSRFPMLVWWGSALVMLYNDAYRPILGQKHPRALGQVGAECWPEIWDLIGPMLNGVLAGGEATWSADQLLVLERNGFPEEGFYTFSYSPIFDESGGVGGVFTAVTETTERVVGERRLRTLANLAESITDLHDVEAIVARAVQQLAADARDNAFAAIMSVTAEGASSLLAAAGEWPAEGLAHPILAQLLSQARETAEAAAWLPDKGCRTRPWGALVAQPVETAADGSRLLLLCGLNAHRDDDAAYRAFVMSAATRVGAVLSVARTQAIERARLKSMAELDQAKTTFFSNVSHELRTPLTLILGPLEQFLAARPDHDGLLATAQRNATRLRRLVNDLLDFSRVEAGKLNPSLEPVDLGRATADVASLYRSTIEAAGLRFEVSSDPDLPSTMVDRTMWEKIVLNLVSNAFKFTHAGLIEVRLRRVKETAVLSVRDTGVGIRPEDQARVFQRFFRVVESQGRTDEGTGIGLALVRELAQLHGGHAEVSSELGRGSEFRITLPLRPAQADASAPVTPAIPPVLHLPASGEVRNDKQTSAPTAPAQLILADDDPDMADYMRRLLEPHWHVTVARSGREALDLALRQPPDVLLTDVMMPGLNGFELVRELRQHPSTRSLPIIMVSARAGEGSHLDGLAAGADDYLVKPFSARDLVARVENQLMRRKLLELDLQTQRRLEAVFSHAPVGIVLFSGPEHRVDFANPFYQTLVPDRQLQGRTIREIFPDLANQGVYELLDSVYSSGRPQVGRSIVLTLESPVTRQFETRHFDFVYQAMPRPDGHASGVIAVVFEVTELARARTEAEDANRAKDEFIAMLGHELRNPLAPIATALHLMKLRGSDLLVKERGIIERQVSHMSRLVNDLLDVARIARGNVELRLAQIDARQAIQAGIEMASPLLEQKSQKLIHEDTGELPVLADIGRLAQTVSNLLTNASKFSPPGSRIWVAADRIAGIVRISVRDEGVGMQAADLQRVFEPFVQLGAGIERAAGGLGLGLAIAHNLVRLHGGSIAAASDGLGTGCTFELSIPLATDADGAEPRDHEGQASAQSARIERSVLVVDDNIDAADTLAALLSTWGCKVQVVTDGPAALAELEAGSFDIAIVDIGLPAMDGHEVAAEVRRRWAGEAPRLFALTGYGQPADRERALASGFEEHFIKPLDVDALQRLMYDQPAKRP